LSSHLTQEDVKRLMKEPSPIVRAEVAGKLAQEIDSPRLSESEINLAHDVVRLMARDIEISVRQALAHSLRCAEKLPHDVAVQLANDVEAVAMPILENSTVLTDDDLIKIISAGSSNKQEAIASRSNVSEQLSDALISSATESAVAKLMNNATAHISDTSMDKAMDRFQGSETVKEAMVTRPILPITVAERLAAVVSARLKEYLVSHHELSSDVASDLVLQSRERTLIDMTTNSSEQDIEKLVLQMYHNKRLTHSIVLRSLCMGDVQFFEAALAVMANVPMANARILIHDAGRLGFKTVYEKAGMPARWMPAARVALDVIHETEMDGEQKDMERYRARVIERVLTQFEDFTPEDLDYLLSKLGDMMSVERRAS